MIQLTLNKPAYVGMCISDLNKVLMQEFPDDQIKNKYGNNSRLLFTETDNLMCGIKTKMFLKISVMKNKCFILVIIQQSKNIVLIQTNQQLEV